MKKLNYREKYRIKVPLRGYQRKAVAKAIQLGGVIALFMAPRLGKTRVAIALNGWLRVNRNIQRWAIICPSIAKEVWATEIADSLDLPYQLEIIEGRAAERQLILKGWKDDPEKLSILIINPEATWRLKKFLYKWNPDSITVDESHRIKNHAAKQSTTIHTFGRRAQYRQILTGTWGAKPTDIFSQFKFLNPDVFGTRWADFLERYTATWGFMGKKPETFKDLDHLTDRVREWAFILNRKEAGGFPQELVQKILFPLTGASKRHYARMEEEMKTYVKGERVTAKIVLTQALRLQQITSGFLPVEDTVEPIGKDRINALRELVSEYAPTEPLVIMARFRYEIAEIEALMKRMGRSVSTIFGGDSNRDQVKKDFQTGKVDTCVVQVRAGGIAIDLSRADTIIFHSMPTFMDYEQAKARIISRRGGDVAILILTAQDTLDELHYESLTTGQEYAEMIMGKFS